MSSRRTVALAAALGLVGYVYVYATGRADLPIRSDGFSYYVYLPSWFIFYDTTLSATAQDCCGGEFPAYSAIIRWPGTRRWVNAHPIGVAVLQAPLFLAAHALTWWTNLPRDGFSLYYQHATGISGLLWTIAGLWMLRRLLVRHFSDRVTSATLITILLGTNLYHYATYDSSYSHAYSFFLFAAFLDLTDRWHHKPDRRLSILLGLVAGLIVLTRHTNALFVICFLLYGVTNRSTLRALLVRLMRERSHVIWGVISMAIVVAPQLAIYYRSTGSFLVSSYGEFSFNFTAPHIWGVLFSVQKGVFFWSPVLLLGAAGLWWLFRTRHAAGAFVFPSAMFLIANTYLIASWWDWQFGGSYGHRGFVDALPIFALGLAGAFTWAGTGRLAQRSMQVVVIALAALSMFQMLQYWNGIIPISDTTWMHYREVFLKWR